MSDEAKPAESPKDSLLGLTSLDFGPAWARGGAEKQERTREGKGRGHHDDRGEGRRDDRREGRRDDRREGRRDDRREGRRDDRREGKGGGGRRFERRERGDRGKGYGRGGRDRRDDERGHFREETPPPEGYTAQVMPVEDGLDGLAKEILAGGRTYSVFDLAKLVLGARERFTVSFRSGKEGGLVRCKRDDSLWLTKEEALRHFMRAPWRKDYYEEVVSQATPPQGNFQTVARCGISGEWLGPPNYHGYQPEVMRMHRERFGHMSLEAYKKKIRMERGEDAVSAWLEKMSKRVAYRPTGGVARRAAAPPSAELAGDEDDSGEAGRPAEAKAAVEEAPGKVESVEAAEAGLEERSPEEPAVEAESADESAAVESAGETSAEGEEDDIAEQGGEEETSSSGETAPDAKAEPLLHEMREVERHFQEHYFDQVFQTSNRAWVGGNIAGNLLSPGLLTLLRHTVAEERRYPAKLTPMLCRQLSGRHVAVFKWRRKLKAGPSRPHPVPDDIAIADRPMSLLNWITENSGKKLEHLWKAVLPKDVSEKEKLGWYHDLHWLLNQGYVLLMADSTIHRSKKPDEGDHAPAQGKSKRANKGESRGEPEKASQPRPRHEQSAPTAEVGTVTRGPALRGTTGLYSLRGCTLSGAPKFPESLRGRGLWPLLSRFEDDQEEDEEDNEEEFF